jgi:hypothetical protein
MNKINHTNLMQSPALLTNPIMCSLNSLIIKANTMVLLLKEVKDFFSFFSFSFLST